MTGLKRWLCALALLLPALASCGCSSAKHKLEAERFVDGYYAALRDGRIDEALGMCAPEFFQSTPRESWLEKLRRTRDSLGALEDFKLQKWTMEILPNGTFTTFEYKVDYARYEAHETITVVAPVREDRLFIFGHHIVSDGMK